MSDNPLAALAMRERAASASTQRKGIGADSMPHPYDAGYLAACDDCTAAIRALPTTFTDAELLAAAMQLPEVRALHDALVWHSDDTSSQGDKARASIAPFRNNK